MHTHSEIRVIDNKFAETHGDGCEKELSKLKFFVRVAAHLLLDCSPERIVERTNDLIEPHLRSRLSELKRSQIVDWTRDEELNRKACNRLCLTLIKPILSKDGYKIASVDTTQFDDSKLNGYAETKRLRKPRGLAEGAAFVAKNNDGHQLLFCFYDKQKDEKPQLYMYEETPEIISQGILELTAICPKASENELVSLQAVSKHPDFQSYCSAGKKPGTWSIFTARITYSGDDMVSEAAGKIAKLLIALSKAGG